MLGHDRGDCAVGGRLRVDERAVEIEDDGADRDQSHGAAALSRIASSRRRSFGGQMRGPWGGSYASRRIKGGRAILWLTRTTVLFEMRNAVAHSEAGFLKGRVMSGGTRNSTAQGVQKAVRLLRCFISSSERTLSVGELSAMTGWTKSSVSRLLSALREGGLVRRDLLTGRYAPGFELVALAGAALSAVPDLMSLHACLESLAAGSHETANLSVLDDGQLLTLDEVASPQPIKLSGWIGARHPLHGSSSGKVLLASLPSSERDAIIARGLAEAAPKTITKKKRLLDELREVRARGIGYNLEELAPGLTSVAAPVRDRTGRVVAAISIAGPTFRFNKRRLDQCVALVKKAALEASRRLGFSSEAA
jgi:DNA-binding IclR family transcriptional regulator